MALSAGSRLGTFEILSPLGAGGMGEVYRARDTKLGREVAIKVLPEAFSRDPEKLARFQREAHLLASLNHPNIATLYGLEESKGQPLLVMELVEGDTLAERIARGQLPLDEALPLFVQIADGLEAAHEKGVIHRDLKPANIKITPEGKPKILDFGLAKALAAQAVVQDLSQSPTLTRDATETGVLLGTAPYMSPEQARGKPIDKRTDIWAFGCCLYEALAGKPAFTGATPSDTMASILEHEPKWQALPDLPFAVQTLIRRCVRKDAGTRLHDIADARIELAEAGASSGDAISPSTPRFRALSWATTGAAAAALMMMTWWSADTADVAESSGPVRFVLALPGSQSIGVATGPEWQQPAVSLSPDGRRIVYVSRDETSRQLWIRELDQIEATPIPGTSDQNVHCPLFSPDGDWVAYFTTGELQKVSLSTGATIKLAETLRVSSGGSWGADGFIYYTDAPVRGLMRVPENGGVPEKLTEPDAANGETAHFYPMVLDDGAHVLFTIRTTRGWNASKIAVLSLATRETKTLIDGAVAPHYLTSGHLLYARAGTLFATRFDTARLSVEDPAIAVLEGVRTRTGADVAVSRNGTLIYVPSRAQTAQRAFVWLDREGRTEPLDLPRGQYGWVQLSPDGGSLATAILDDSGHSDILVAELSRRTLAKLTPGPGSRFAPIWTPDGLRVTFSATRAGRAPELFWKRADGSVAEEQLAQMPLAEFPTSWSPDGKTLAFNYENLESKFDIYVLEPGGEPRPFLATEFNESAARFSPDGRFLAYESDESGRNEIYLLPFPGPGEKHLVSREGGSEPVWAAGGREIFFRHNKTMFAVPVETSPELTLGVPEPLFEHDAAIPNGLNIPSFDVTRDARRFLAIAETDDEMAPRAIHVVLSWFDELERLVPTDK